MVRAKTPARTILITDAMAAAGCAPGKYELNGELVELSPDGSVSPPGKPWLAGSSLTLERAVANLVQFAGVPLETAWAMASTQPAQFLGLPPAGKVRATWNAAEFRFEDLQVMET
jgi:N-acetylglucosamine-6-phosphate deacetylase